MFEEVIPSVLREWSRTIVLWNESIGKCARCSVWMTFRALCFFHLDTNYRRIIKTAILLFKLHLRDDASSFFEARCEAVLSSSVCGQHPCRVTVSSTSLPPPYRDSVSCIQHTSRLGRSRGFGSTLILKSELLLTVAAKCVRWTPTKGAPYLPYTSHDMESSL